VTWKSIESPSLILVRLFVMKRTRVPESVLLK
jgi:hypothetical protein